MTGPEGEDGRAQGVSAASLRLLSRRVLDARRARYANILVTGGDAAVRAGVVSRLDRSSVRARTLCVVTIPRDTSLLRQAVRCWLGLDPGPMPLTCEHGTLYVDGVSKAPLDVQRLLLQLADRLALTTAADSRLEIGPERLAAGTDERPEEDVVHGRLLAGLLDRVDKLRVDLGVATSRYSDQDSTMVRAAYPAHGVAGISRGSLDDGASPA